MYTVKEYFCLILVTYSLVLIGNAVRHWTMITPEPGVYVMAKEQRADIPLRISNMHDELMAFIRLHLDLTVR